MNAPTLTQPTEAQIDAVEQVLIDAEPMLDQAFEPYYRSLAVSAATAAVNAGGVLDAADDLLAAADRFDAAEGEGRR